MTDIEVGSPILNIGSKTYLPHCDYEDTNQSHKKSIGLTQLNAQSPRSKNLRPVVRRFIAAQDNSQRPMNRATTVGAPLRPRREQRSLFPTEVRNSYLFNFRV